MPIIDLCLILNVPPEIGLQRANRRGDRLTTFEKADLEFHQRVREAFLEEWPPFLSHLVSQRRVIDSTRPKEDVAAEVYRAVEELILALRT